MIFPAELPGTVPQGAEDGKFTTRGGTSYRRAEPRRTPSWPHSPGGGTRPKRITRRDEPRPYLRNPSLCGARAPRVLVSFLCGARTPRVLSSRGRRAKRGGRRDLVVLVGIVSSHPALQAGTRNDEQGRLLRPPGLGWSPPPTCVGNRFLVNSEQPGTSVTD